MLRLHKVVRAVRFFQADSSAFIYTRKVRTAVTAVQQFLDSTIDILSPR